MVFTPDDGSDYYDDDYHVPTATTTTAAATTTTNNNNNDIDLTTPAIRNSNINQLYMGPEQFSIGLWVIIPGRTLETVQVSILGSSMPYAINPKPQTPNP